MLASYFSAIALDSQTVLLLLSIVFNTLLGILIVAHQRRDFINRVYVFNIACIVWWSAMIVCYRLVPGDLLWWTIGLYVAPTFIASSFLYFVFFFPEEHARIRFRRSYLALIIALNALAVGLTLVPGLVITGVDKVPGGENIIHFGSLYILYALYISGFFGLGLLILARKLILIADPLKRRQLAYLLWGYLVASVSAMVTNLTLPYLGYFAFNWLGQVMTVFMVLPVTYAIFRLRLFDVKLIASELITMSLWVFFFVRVLLDTDVRNRALDMTLLGVMIIAGTLLIRSVRREVEQRERIEKLAEELQETNERQEGLIHFLGHEVKGFLTKDEGAFAALVEGDFGALPDNLKPFVARALAQTRDGVRSVTDILKAANQKNGTLEYKKDAFDLKALIAETVEAARANAEAKGLRISFVAEGTGFQMAGDRAEIGDHVLRNLLDNAINYTPSGTITAVLRHEAGKLVFSVKDTGVGITEEDKKGLFTEGGHGKDSQKVNVHSTGYGLYIAKNIVEAHHGTIRAESDGSGKGSTFLVEFPA